MNKKQEKKVSKILTKLYDLVLAEESGSAEHICEWFSSKDIEKLIEELNIEIKSNLTKGEIEEVVDGYFDEEEPDTFDFDALNLWIDYNTDCNKAARAKVIEEVKKRFGV